MDKIAFLFAGQGAQHPGMAKDLYQQSPAANKLLSMAEDLHPGTLATLFEADAQTLAQTIHTQPCVFLADLAAARALDEAGICAQAVAGFSLGEMAALAYAGVFTDEQAFLAVLCRAQLMQQAAEENPGAMTAVLKLSAEEVQAVAAQVGGAYPVNYNAPGQTVVAAGQAQIEAFEAAAKEAGGRCVRLNVGGAFHSPLMQQASDSFYTYLSSLALHEPRIPVYANLSGQPYEGELAKTLALQTKSPVRWVDTIKNMQADGVSTFVELGPGKTLSGLVKKIGGAGRILSAETSGDIALVCAALKEDDHG